jgi:uncharacterized iron-regulated protein
MLTPAAADNFDIYHLESHKKRPLTEVLPQLAAYRLVLVGESHTDQAHHRGQLAVIAGLNKIGRALAIGMEMFRSDNQQALDRWITGELSEKEFERIYYENWNYPWELYRPIFIYAREHRIPMVGLNVPQAITRQVAREGFASLSEEQKKQLPPIACRVDKAYMDYIRKAFGAHAHGQLNFTYFCEAQLVWDGAMAYNALAYLENHPERQMVLLAGSGHVHKMGIPSHIKDRSSMPVAVILPPGTRDVAFSDADYILLL